MEKRVILKLDGILDLDFWSDGDRQLELAGYLPPNPELAELLNQHWQKDRQIGTCGSRLQPESIEL
ncbi:MAG: hypothetical protein WBB29_09355 [Geitlerinemataceae cyanobacterium]